MSAGRREHYAEFYGVRPPLRGDGPLVLTHGNCQAESLRVLLQGSAEPVSTIRVPPVHELEPADLPHLQRIVERIDVLVSQPVREGYRGLPLGTAELLARAARRPRLVTVPVVRWAALHPFQVIVRSPEAGEPPVVPYHDLRTLSVAAGGGELPDVPSPEAVRAVRDLSVRELTRRQDRHGALDVVDLLVHQGANAAHTVNHPGNGVLLGLAERVLAAVGLPQLLPDPGRTLLDAVHAPVLPAVLDALDLPSRAARTSWTVAGRVVRDDDVRRAQLEWYRRWPGVAAAGLRRHAEAHAAWAQ
ncbi:hypothetical protein D9V37_14525 [Nocardioides mangrovicus]|uniref:Polysaccharide biosynthesis enzyme WcbI domain-containing protein n=1 Tax=Nocardioides mangrovicus TaxID=2478913 RepID=A0A3L8NZG9_9ACTN|nr:WcbI family polysaccharide biosynthesis putative acetyltransferase [Nocardioides mangrovicus]RLV48575.1 hypothetical protein D9V37_14525 [Nocardioides mangrovicus]